MKPIKFICALPFYLVAVVAVFFIMLSARVIDYIYPDSKTSISFIRMLLGFNTSAESIDPSPKTTFEKIKIYR
jgi:hypothetical protein